MGCSQCHGHGPLKKITSPARQNIRRPSGKTVLDTQVLWSVPPEPSKARTSESLGQRRDHIAGKITEQTEQTEFSYR